MTPTKTPTGQTVYIAGLGHHDYEPAKEFGDLKVVISGQVDLTKLSELLEKIRDAMHDSQPGDYVLLSGAPLICLLCVLHLMDKHGAVNVLQWDGVLRDYVPHELTAPDPVVMP